MQAGGGFGDFSSGFGGNRRNAGQWFDGAIPGAMPTNQGGYGTPGGPSFSSPADGNVMPGYGGGGPQPGPGMAMSQPDAPQAFAPPQTGGNVMPGYGGAPQQPGQPGPGVAMSQPDAGQFMQPGGGNVIPHPSGGFALSPFMPQFGGGFPPQFGGGAFNPFMFAGGPGGYSQPVNNPGMFSGWGRGNMFSPQGGFQAYG